MPDPIIEQVHELAPTRHRLAPSELDALRQRVAERSGNVWPPEDETQARRKDERADGEPTEVDGNAKP